MNNSTEIKDYVKELIHLRDLGLIEGEQAVELDSLIKVIEGLETKESKNKENWDLNKLQIKYVNKSNNPEPTWAKEGDSGFDFRAELEEIGGNYTLKPLERALIPTGLYFELPTGYELQVRPRSGHSFKTGLMAILGTVDTGYRGEVKVIVVNLSDKEYTIEQGERIAQGVVASRISSEFGKLVKLESVEELSTTERGESGFGSTGKN
jgi:dUTP pyrophosphatase